MIPVYLKTGDATSPDDQLYYVVAANGTFIVRNTALFTATTRTREVIGLEPHDEQIALRFPKLPREVMERILGFFTSVYRKWDGEAIAFVFYSADRREFRLEIPPQTLWRFKSGGRWHTTGKVEYGAVCRPDGFLKLGDVHSHGDSPAFFSRTDDRDDDEDGLRVVIGHLDRPEVEMRASFIVNGWRFNLRPEEVIDLSSVPISPVPPPEDWMRRVTCRYETPQNRSHGWGGNRYEH